MRVCIILQKASVGIGYALFLLLFLRQDTLGSRGVWVVFGVITISSSVLNLVTVRPALSFSPCPVSVGTPAYSECTGIRQIAISVSIERDWVTVIAEASSNRLTRLNTWLRRIDLISKLVGPLFVSLLTTAVSLIPLLSLRGS